MTNEEIFDFFVDILRENHKRRIKLSGLPAHISEGISQISRNMVVWLGQCDSQSDLRDLSQRIAKHFGDIGNELRLKMYDKKLGFTVIPAIQVYNYIVSAIEIVADYFQKEIPEELFWDDEDDDIQDIDDSPIAEVEPLKKTQKKAEKNDKTIDLLESINTKLDKLINIIEKSIGE